MVGVVWCGVVGSLGSALGIFEVVVGEEGGKDGCVVVVVVVDVVVWLRRPRARRVRE